MSRQAKKVLGTYWDEPRGTEFFFAGNEIITGIDSNDGGYRHEYMDCLFNHFGVEVKVLKKLSVEQKKTLLRYCRDYEIFTEEEQYE